MCLFKRKTKQKEEEDKEVQTQPIEYPRFIPNSPSGEDKFEGGSQSRLSKAIARYFRSNDSLNEGALPRIIGIEGQWGSGKSNVVKMLREQLKGEYHFFEYDAWGYQEDLQRRSILELLTQDLVKNNILFGKTTVEDLEGNKKVVTWTERLKYFLARKSERESKSYPRITIGLGATILASFLFLVFWGIAYKYNLCLTGMWEIIVAIFLQIVSIILWVIDFRKKRKYRLDYLLAISQNKIDENISYEILIEEEPTAYKFKEWLQIISDFLGEKKGPKLVVVFDNMDRLSAEKVKEFWSLIHTFFADGGFKNIWAVIPFDKDHLSCAFRNEGEDSAEKLTKFFIEKTFPIVYRVAPPVITDYRGIFDKLFDEAFGPSESPDSREIINRMFRIENPATNVRNIISFINEMVALKQEWGKSISIENIALFCLEKEQILNNPVNEILSGSYLLNTNSIIDNCIQLQREMAALVYGVEVEYAQQIPLTRYIEYCINGKPGYDINQYAESNAHFDIVLDEVEKNMDIDKCICCLNKLTRKNERISSIWRDLARKKLAVPIEKQEFSMEYKALLLHLDSDMQNIIISRLYQEILHFTNFKGAYYFNALYEMDQFIKENGLSCDFMSIIQEKEVNPTTFIEFVRAANKEQIVFSDHEDTIMCDGYHIKTNLESLDDYLSKLKFNHTDVLSAIKKNSSYEFPKLLNVVTNLVKEQRVNKDNAGVIFASYRILAPLEEMPLGATLKPTLINQIHSELESDGKDIQHSGYYDFVAMKIANNQPVTLISGGEIKYVADVIDCYINYGDLLKQSLSSNDQILKDLLKYMIENHLGFKISFPSIFRYFDEIRRKIEVTEEALLENLCEWDSKSINKGNIKICIPNASFYEVTTRIDTPLSKHINQVAVEVLSERSAKLLYSQRMDSSNYWNVAIVYLLKVMDSLPDNLVEFCKEVFWDIALGRQEPDQLPDYLKSMISKLDSRIESAVIDIKNSFCKGDQSINPTKFYFFESYFRLYGNLIETPDDVVNKIILPVIDDEDCRNLILQHRDFYIDLISAARDSSNEIKKRFREMITPDSSSELVDFLETIDPNPRAEDSSESK